MKNLKEIIKEVSEDYLANIKVKTTKIQECREYTNGNLQNIINLCNNLNLNPEDVTIGVDDSEFGNPTYIYYEKEVNKSEDELKESVKKVFNVNIFTKIYKEAIKNGYKRTSLSDYSYYKKVMEKYNMKIGAEKGDKRTYYDLAVNGEWEVFSEVIGLYYQ